MQPRKNKGGKEPVYGESLKIAVARDYLTGNLSFRQIAEKYQLKNLDVPRWFVRWYNTRYATELSVLNSSPPEQAATGPVEVKELEKRLANANLKIAALEIMIEIAEKDLGIDIRKKPGTKQ